jgi:hypothetical protein
MKIINLILNGIICLSALAGLVALVFGGWEPKPYIIALAAFSALLRAYSTQMSKLID